MLLATAAGAQGSAPLPGALSGRWTFVGPAGVATDSFSIQFDGAGVPGKVSGRLTWRGRNCGARDEPIQGSWDGVELTFEAVLKANTNTQRMNGDCTSEPGRWVLKRKGGERSFEGEARVGALVVAITAAP